VATDPLIDLLLDADEVDRATLSRALLGLLGIDSNTGRVVLKPGFAGLGARKKVLAYLLGAKVAVLLAKAESEAVSPIDVSRQTGLPRGTVNPKLSELYEQRLVSKTDVGAYYIAPHQIHVAVEELQEGQHETGEGDESAASRKAPQKRRRKTSRKRTRKKEAASSDALEEGGQPRKRRVARTARTGPRTALRQLAEGEFLKSPRTIGDIRKHLETKRALRFKPEDLSPHLGFLVREGLLEREKNDDNVYEYKLASGE
jgi:hypothetical protein